MRQIDLEIIFFNICSERKNIKNFYVIGNPYGNISHPNIRVALILIPKQFPRGKRVFYVFQRSEVKKYDSFYNK
jgi:hypothetical protein